MRKQLNSFELRWGVRRHILDLTSLPVNSSILCIVAIV